MQQSRPFALACLVLAMALWGSSFIALKLAFAEWPAMWVIFARMAIGSLIFLAAWRWRGRMDYQAGDWKYLVGLAVCEPCLYFVCESFALQYTSAAQAGMITALLPLLVAVGAFLLLHERIARNTWAGFALAVLGALWLTLAGEPDRHAPQPLLGNFFELLAMVCATGYTLLLKHLSARYSPFILTAMQAFIGSVFFLPLAAVGSGVPPAPSGHVYQVWFQNSAGSMVSAGLMPAGKDQMLLAGDARTAQAVGVAVEPEGGSESPTTTPVALVGSAGSGVSSVGYFHTWTGMACASPLTSRVMHRSLPIFMPGTPVTHAGRRQRRPTCSAPTT